MPKIRVRADALKACIARRNETQAIFAGQVGSELRLVQRWLAGEVEPSPHARRKICAITGMNFDDLFEFVDGKSA